MLVKDFLDRALTTRLAIQILIEHHMELRHDRPNSIGVISMNFSPKEFIDHSVQSIQSVRFDLFDDSVEFLFSRDRKVFRSLHGRAPEVTIDGHVHSTFPYLATALDYIVPEMLKNAFRLEKFFLLSQSRTFPFRATVEHHRNSTADLPPVRVTISVNNDHLVLR